MSVYKRVLALGLSLLMLFSLAACTVQPGEDYAEFVPPEETDTLVVYEHPLLSYLMDNAVTLFKRKYPDVNVEYRRYSFEQYEERNTTLKAELAAGEGPDILLDTNLDFDLSTVKAMENGVYADLAPFFAWDEEIDLADYNEAALNAGMYKGRRYMVPLSFQTMIWITTKENLDEAGLDIEGGRQDFEKVMDMLRAYHQKNPAWHLLINERSAVQFLSLFIPYSGVKTLNIEDRKILLDTEEYRSIVDAYKDLFYEDDWANPAYAPQYGFGLTNHDLLFQWSYDLRNIADLYSVLKSTQRPVLVTCPSFDGQVTGRPDVMAFIREGSPNQLNAWRFLKILLSEEFQSEIRNYEIELPVLRSAAKAKLTYLFTNIYTPETWTSEYGVMTRAEVTEEEIDAILDMVYEIDDCRPDPLRSLAAGYMFPYIEGESSYESCLADFIETVTLMLNE